MTLAEIFENLRNNYPVETEISPDNDRRVILRVNNKNFMVTIVGNKYIFIDGSRVPIQP